MVTEQRAAPAGRGDSDGNNTGLTTVRDITKDAAAQCWGLTSASASCATLVTVNLSCNAQAGGWRPHTRSVRHMLLLGDMLLTATDNEMKVWSVNALITADFDAAEECCMTMDDGFVITAVVHPPTYLNKVRRAFLT